MAEEPAGEKTEKATPRRREEARKKGEVARSREIPAVLVLLTGLLALYLGGQHLWRQLTVRSAHWFHQAGAVSLNPATVLDLHRELLVFLLTTLAPILLAVTAMAVLANYAQVGALFAPQLLKPDLNKINLFKGLQRLFSLQSWAELLKSVCKLLIIGWVAAATIQKELPEIVPLLDKALPDILAYMLRVALAIFFKALLAMLALAALDYFFQRYRYEKRLRMSPQEMKEEYKQTEGDPLIKSRIRSIQREMARRRMMAEVPRADVVITNPTHLAVALRYRNQEMAAPQVVAKGAGLVAEKIKETARRHGVPLVENKPVAQTLFKTVDLGQFIPPGAYQVVAEILAYVYRLKNKRN
ncbi:MAG: flagellar biosynthesis protein FlhB [Desulfobacterota bacterium]|jgi:flagellar biosynthetic protein FlhB|nr:flagellar biosynthesis protein FlhB [Thermodesulfobacteriota bacterium]